MFSHAEFSPDRIYRYSLYRFWDETKGYVQFIGLNPSTADETINDPTIRRCIEYATSWGYGGLCMTNLFAYRATLPKDMKAFPEPIGPDNDAWISAVADGTDLVIAGWGNHGTHLNRYKSISYLLSPNKLKCIELNTGEKLTAQNQPGHPLYLRKNAPLHPYSL